MEKYDGADASTERVAKAAMMIITDSAQNSERPILFLTMVFRDMIWLFVTLLLSLYATREEGPLIREQFFKALKGSIEKLERLK